MNIRWFKKQDGTKVLQQENVTQFISYGSIHLNKNPMKVQEVSRTWVDVPTEEEPDEKILVSKKKLQSTLGNLVNYPDSFRGANLITLLENMG